MTYRQINSYRKRINPNDPNLEMFETKIIPSLSGQIKNDVTVYVCPLCEQKNKFLNAICSKSSLSSSNSTQNEVIFTQYYTFIRHYTEKHSSVLPCNGTVFSADDNKRFTPSNTQLDRMFKCVICNESFNRKEHLNKHFESKKHKRNERLLCYEDESCVSKTKAELDIKIREQELVEAEAEQFELSVIEEDQKRQNIESIVYEYGSESNSEDENKTCFELNNESINKSSSSTTHETEQADMNMQTNETIIKSENEIQCGQKIVTLSESFNKTASSTQVSNINNLKSDSFIKPIITKKDVEVQTILSLINIESVNEIIQHFEVIKKEENNKKRHIIEQSKLNDEDKDDYLLIECLNNYENKTKKVKS